MVTFTDLAENIHKHKKKNKNSTINTGTYV